MKYLQPGSIIGIIGGGQLGRMLAMTAQRMGYRTAIWDPSPTCPASSLAETLICAPFSDHQAAEHLAKLADVITYEFEHIDLTTVQTAANHKPVYPHPDILAFSQHRVVEKSTLQKLGFPVPPFAAIDTLLDLETAIYQIGLPAVLKTATSGYDGKGQVVLRSQADLKGAYAELRPKSDRLIIESFVPFSKEVSVLCARGQDGEVVSYPIGENQHVQGILDMTLAPADVPPEIDQKARQMVESLTTKLNVVGLLVVELFLLADGSLLINETAPRPHNSGHYTLDVGYTSQFEQLIRALCGLPLGSTQLLSPAVMVNLLGDLWLTTENKPPFDQILALPGVKLHLYGKKEARAGRKMGHFTVMAPTLMKALHTAKKARALLTPSHLPT